MFRTTTQKEGQEKAFVRADLIAAGIIRYHKYKLLSPREMQQALEILADELANIDGQEEALAIRTNIERCGLQIPKPSAPVRLDGPVGLDPTVEIGDSEGPQSCRMPKNAHTQGHGHARVQTTAVLVTQEQESYPYVRHGNHQASEEVEMHIRELLGRGWSKSAIARVLHVNRRVVIRVAREATQRRRAQSAQSSSDITSNLLGKS
ncbi:MAG TPA: hypothetical protein VMU57_02895 [Edaphobacter sp.]|uniref:hypothetical protein n=1 Tax=Edaphobacter sp. TaxID=1934404 RepID=UPI002D0B89A6|nr:hypothetical protein [Edaphobacter sp.]HUZ93838.1 hypothetical protein [Edaphobacter sp.]